MGIAGVAPIGVGSLLWIPQSHTNDLAIPWIDDVGEHPVGHLADSLGMLSLGCSRGISMKRRLTDLNRYVRGWIGYFGLARQFDDFADLDGWIRRRVRMCYWKQWRYPRTKVRNLLKLGVSLDMAIKHAVSRKGYWRMSRTPAMRYAMPNKWLVQQGLLSLKQLWSDLAPLRGTA